MDEFLPDIGVISSMLALRSWGLAIVMLLMASVAMCTIGYRFFVDKKH